MPDDPNLWWRAAANARSPEVWAGIAGGMIYVYRKSVLPSPASRMAEAVASGLLAYSTGERAAQWANVHKGFAVAIITALGCLVLDFGRSIAADRKVLKDIIIKLLRGQNG